MTLSEDFLKFACEKKALQFGDFSLKSGRQSPYFFNTGNFNSGSSLSQLATFYADALIASGLEFDFLFGPAYKGISLAAAVACALWSKYGKDVPFASDRKELKTHGEGGSVLGAGGVLSAGGRKIVIVDDVITAGTAIREAISFIHNLGINEIVGVVISLDRQERVSENSAISAVQSVEREFGLQVISIGNLDSILNFSNFDEKVKLYRDKYRCE